MVAALFAQEAGEHAVETAVKAASWFTTNAWLIPAISFAAVVLIAAVGKRLPRHGSEIGIIAQLVAVGLSIGTLANYIGGNGPLHEAALDWFPFGGGFSLELGMRMDGLTAIMFLVVTIVSLMMQIYSTAYMHDSKRQTWYFTAVNLFTGSMLLLVISNNLLQMLMGWELVGVCSYFLIGFWWEKTENSNAAIKAFVMTKTGDVPFVIGIFVLFAATKTFNIGEILEAAEGHHIGATTLTAAAILLFGGAVGKSAQFPLYVWLPDAMAGPTPVSALIHAATMVTAGVFMVARMFPIYEVSEAAMTLVAVIGALTMLMAALLAVVQDDVKKVLAYSTISQLAYMFAALGVGAGNAAIFHLFTHAWFKALLFLCAGSMIHAVHSNSMSDMGGLKKFMPWTYRTFAVGTIALAGVPPFAGFWSKDEILTDAFRHGSDGHFVGYLVYGVGLLTAFLTAFYMSRAFHLSFEGSFRGHGKPHESPRAMVFPLQVLAVLAMVAGFVGFPGWKSGFSSWVAVGGEAHASTASLPLIVISVAVAVSGLALGRKLYKEAPAVDPVTKLGPMYRVLVNKYYLDDLYYKGIVYPIRDSISAGMYWLNQNVFDGAVNGAATVAKASAKGLYDVVDQKVIDGAVNGAGFTARLGSKRLRLMQTGDVQRYAAVLFAGVAVLAFLFTKF